MLEPAFARIVAGRAGNWIVGSASALGLTALLGVLLDSGWPLAQSLLGAALMASLLVLAGVSIQHIAVPRQEVL